MRFTLLKDGGITTQEFEPAFPLARPSTPPRSRVVYAAAHVVPRTTADNTPGAPADLDWDSTLAFRRHIWSWGLGVADAMDTAQRNMGLDGPATTELIERSAAAARDFLEDVAVPETIRANRSVRDLVVAGVNTDGSTTAPGSLSLKEITAEYLRQLHAVEATGAGAVLMCSRHLAAAARTEEDFRTVYRDVLAEASGPVVIHWLGEAFDPSLRGYFGSTDFPQAARAVLRIIEDAGEKVGGIKMSLLDSSTEIHMRRALPEGVIMLTGDDFHYVDLIAGDEHGYSDALLGAFAAVAPSAAVAIQHLDNGDAGAYRETLSPTEALSRTIFEAPTFHYKTGVAFMSWLNGHQPAFQMVGGLHAARSLPHLSEVVRLAAASNALEQPELAAERWHGLLTLNGITPDGARPLARDTAEGRVASASAEDTAGVPA